MSRIGKLPISIPKGVTVAVDGNTVRVMISPPSLVHWVWPAPSGRIPCLFGLFGLAGKNTQAGSNTLLGAKAAPAGGPFPISRERPS